MCRNIRTLFNFTPPASDEEVRASSLQFVRKLARGRADVPCLIGEAQRSVAQRDQHLQPRNAIGNIEHRIAQIADFAGQSAQVAPIKFVVGVAEHQGRLRQQRDHAARQHVGAAANGTFLRRI